MKRKIQLIMIFIISITLLNPIVSNAETIDKSTDATQISGEHTKTVTPKEHVAIEHEPLIPNELVEISAETRANTINIPDSELVSTIALECDGTSWYCLDTSGDFLYIDTTDGIQESEMLEIGTLKSHGVSTDISNLEGLQYAQNITEIDFAYNSITDLSPLSGLNNLEWLDIFQNDVSDLSPLSGLPNLELIDFTYNNISDIEVVRTLPNLESFWGDFNNISDLSPFENSTTIETIHLAVNNISDLTPLENLTTLKRIDFAQNNISDLTPLENLTNLEQITLFTNNISDLTPLENLYKLNYLSIGSNPIDDLTPISGLTNMTKLYIETTNVTDLTPIKDMVLLEDLFIRYNDISNLDALENMNLVQFDAKGDLLTDVGVLSGMTNLKFINISDNELTDISNLTDLPALERFYVSGNHISDLSNFKDSSLVYEGEAAKQRINLGSVDVLEGSTSIEGYADFSTTQKLIDNEENEYIVTLPKTISGDPASLTDSIAWSRPETGGTDAGLTTTSFQCSFTDGYSEVPANVSDYSGCEYVAVPFAHDSMSTVPNTGTDGIDYTGFTGWVYYQVNYSPFALNLSTSADITEEAFEGMTDSEIKTQLLNLFNVEAIDEDSVTSVDATDMTVDYSTCDFAHPGSCDVTFSFVGSLSGTTHSKTATLNITNIVPTISTSKESIDVVVGDEEIDYLSTFEPLASGEKYLLNPSDSTDIAIADYPLEITNTCSTTDGKYDEAGTCNVTFSINDDDDLSTLITKTAAINVSEAPVTTDPEIDVEDEQEVAVTGIHIYPIIITLIGFTGLVLIRRYNK